jgi:hypothetical protein
MPGFLRGFSRNACSASPETGVRFRRNTQVVAVMHDVFGLRSAKTHKMCIPPRRMVGFGSPHRVVGSGWLYCAPPPITTAIPAFMECHLGQGLPKQSVRRTHSVIGAAATLPSIGRMTNPQLRREMVFELLDWRSRGS